MEGNNNLNNANGFQNPTENNIQPNQMNITNDVPVTTQVPAMEPNVNMEPANGNQDNNTTNKKKNSVAIVVGLVVFGLAIAALVFFLLTNANKKDNEDNDTNKEPDTNNKVEEVVWNGVYESEQGTVYLYQLNDEELSYSMLLDGSSISGTADIDGNTAEGEIFDTYSFVLNGNNLDFTTTSEDVTADTFTKTKEYTTTDYFSDNFGDPKYLESDINGVFGDEAIVIKIYQQSEDSAYITILKDYSIYGKGIDIVNGELVLEDEFFGDMEKINATIKDNQLVITASSTDSGSLLNEVSGTYTKTGSYTMEDIISNEN